MSRARGAPASLSTGSKSSGEAEPVLVRTASGELFVGVGSDHTDRDLERVSILESKRACPKVVGGDVWRFDDVERTWDELVLASTVGRRPYQRGDLSALRGPHELLALLPNDDPEVSALVLFMGTIPLLDGTFRYGGSFEASLADPHGTDALTCAYRW